MKVLVITYWFPPVSAIGARRWGEFFELSKFDEEIEIDILTANWKDSIGFDKNVYYVGKEVEYNPPTIGNAKMNFLYMLKHPTLLMRSIDRSLKSNWYKKSKEWIDNNTNKYDLVISSYKPIASIFLGNRVKRKYKIPHIVDLRDLISIQGQKRKFFLFHFLDKCIDKFIMRNVDAILVTSPISQKKTEDFYNKKVYTIFNGISNTFCISKTVYSLKNIKRINILYMGTLGPNRNPHTILKILNEFCQINQDIQITIKFASQSNPFDFIKLEEMKYLEVNWLGYLSPEELTIEKDLSDVFLVLEDLEDKGSENVPAKTFEYIQCEKPLLLSCHKNSFITQLVNEMNVGSVISDVYELDKFFKTDKVLNIDKINFYTRKYQYQLLKEIIKNLG